MRQCLVMTLVLAAGCLLLISDLGAGDKKGPEKKAEPIVVNAELIKADLKDKVIANSFCKTYTIKLEKDKGYLFEMQSNVFRPYLRLENAAGQQIAADFDRFGNQTAGITHRATKTEDYQIIATTLNAGGVGKFTLTVKELSGDEGKPIELKLAKGLVTHEGNLARTDPKYMNKIHKFFVVQLEKGSTYQIDLMAKNFDAYLYLEDPDGKVLAQDDDGGDGLNSRISHKVNTSGKYRVVATSLGGASIGPFTFQVRQTAGDPPPEEKKDAKDKK